ncbi:hypothetical protein, partial [Salmonella enterica]|uniref:hypothetical protein n=1 Tax=Salmonella enterica TaxID=28901 RepID=UPI0032970587
MKSSVIALALFLFLFALPSLASRPEPSLLDTDGNNEYFVSALREVVQDGLNLVISGSDCPKKTSWPELVGQSGKAA